MTMNLPASCRAAPTTATQCPLFTLSSHQEAAQRRSPPINSSLRFGARPSLRTRTRPRPPAALAISNGTRWTASQWLDSTAQVEVGVPLSVAWDLWADRERVNRWMPWIHSIKVRRDKPELSDWLLKYNAFGQDLEFKWTARNLQPIRHQKIHWRSVDGLPNRGTVRFYPRGPSSVGVQLTISYEVPDVLAGLVASLSPLVERILQQDLERFAAFAKEHSLTASAK